MITSAVTVGLVERLGSKFLLTTGCAIMMVSLFVLSESFWDWDEKSNAVTSSINVVDGANQKKQRQNLIILSSIFLYIAGYQVCFGPITWCIVSETFPIEVRSKAIALCVELNYALNFGVQFVFPILKEKLGWGRTFLTFSTFLGFAIFYIRLFVPETAGMTLEEIETELSAAGATATTTTNAADASTKEEEDEYTDRFRSNTKKKSITSKNHNQRQQQHSATTTTASSIVPTEQTQLLVVRRVGSETFLGAH